MTFEYRKHTARDGVLDDAFIKKTGQRCRQGELQLSFISFPEESLATLTKMDEDGAYSNQ